MTTLQHTTTSSELARSDVSVAPNRAQVDNRDAVTLLKPVAVSAAWVAARVWRTTTAGLATRYVAHFTILMVILVAALLNHPAQAGNGHVTLANQVLAARSGTDSTLLQIFAERGLLADSNVVSPLALAHTTIPQRLRREIQVYHVQPGDTVQGIAATFGLNPETIMWSNPAIEDQPDFLKIGQEVVILPIDGVYHEVKDGDTLESIAKQYKVDISNITDVEWNNLQPPDYVIVPGMKLIVKDGVKPFVPKVVTTYSGPVPSGVQGTGKFLWPVIGYITQSYWSGHRAVDIAAPPNTEVHAADAGYVSFAGWTDVGYGYLVVIDHGNGWQTYYAHNNSFAVVLGQEVARGQVISYSGSTGHSTGPHVHFEIRYNGVPQNPLIYLP